jgi:hypothetical protein
MFSDLIDQTVVRAIIDYKEEKINKEDIMRTYEGLLEIPLEEFWDFVVKYLPDELDEMYYGVPRINQQNYTMEIDYAGDSTGSPENWKVLPKAVTQWRANREKES